MRIQTSSIEESSDILDSGTVWLKIWTKKLFYFIFELFIFVYEAFILKVSKMISSTIHQLLKSYPVSNLQKRRKNARAQPGITHTFPPDVRSPSFK